ncbi:mycofactocin-coupled SDR family oxidoreductase [Rhodococcus sp. LB1]|uniref:mycofactocin-coupled SDR family oxidoreductase n=1 Tax=Rhodococcus sp. LB1 TaxID=1807499 RepID=UPI00077A9277|nr:mycofactocin-coupled SDR family oxidoreductase [Rhodococcus sp. LB1]KXX59112.1 oxidoreductase [Rhodococcus sp. LB1]
MGTLEGKVALVTGGARGQGLAHAHALANEGADIVLLDICEQIDSVQYGLSTEEDLTLAAKSVGSLGVRVATHRTDARSSSALDVAAAETVAAFGSIDIVVINHGIWTRGALWDLTDEDWLDTIDVNLNGVWRTLRAVAPQLITQRSGSVIITASVNGVEAQAGAAHYTAAKHGALGLMKAAALEFAPYGVRVNAILPGFVDTAMTNWQGCYDMTGGKPGSTRADHEAAARHWHAIGGLIEPDEISGAVVYLASDAARRVTGVELPVDGGHLVLSTFNPNPS